MLLAGIAAMPASTWAADATTAVLPRLCGIVVSSRDRMAIFETAPGVTIAAAEGEQVGPYLIRGIAGHEVRVDQGERGLTLTIVGSGRLPEAVDTGGATFGLMVNPQGPPDD